MEDDNPRPVQRQRIEGPAPAQAPAVQVAPVDIELDRELSRIRHRAHGQSAGERSGEERYINSYNRGGGNEFRSFHQEYNNHIASLEPDGENTRRMMPNGELLPVQTSSQSSREGLDHTAQQPRAPGSLAVEDMSRSNLDVRTRREERERNLRDLG